MPLHVIPREEPNIIPVEFLLKLYSLILIINPNGVICYKNINVMKYKEGWGNTSGLQGQRNAICHSQLDLKLKITQL